MKYKKGDIIVFRNMSFNNKGAIHIGKITVAKNSENRFHHINVPQGNPKYGWTYPQDIIRIADKFETLRYNIAYGED